MSLLDCLVPRTVQVPQRKFKTTEAQRRAKRNWYHRNRDKVLAKMKANGWK